MRLEEGAGRPELWAACPDLIAVVDGDLVLREVLAGLTVFGAKDRTELEGRPVSNWLTATQAEGAAQALRLTLQTGEPRSFEVASPTTAIGRSWEVRFGRVSDDRAIAVVRESTVRRAITERLVEAQRAEAISRLAGGLAHDFNNLLTVITTAVASALTAMEALPPGPLDEELGEDLNDILAASRRAAGMTRQLIGLTRRQSPTMERLDLRAIVYDLEPLLTRLLDASIELTLEAPRQVRVVSADRGQIEQVLMNLVINARDAMPSGGRLTISVSDRDGQVAVEVADTGVGMDAETAARAFEPFFTTKPPDRGTGLGLSTSRALVEGCGGTLRVRTAPGDGATFVLALPGLDGAAPTPSSSQPLASLGVERPGAVLVIEDEPAVRRAVARVLHRGGLTVLTAGDGHEALRIASDPKARIELVLSDIILPDRPGPEIARAVLELHPDARVLFVSGFAPNDLDYGELPAGAGFLQKPFSPQTLLERIDQLLSV